MICACLLIGVGPKMLSRAMKMNRGTTIVADTELDHLRSQLLVEFVAQIKDSMSIGRYCTEQLRLPHGQELLESGQNLLVLIKSREKDFASIFGDTPEVVDRIVSGIEQMVLVCHAEGNRHMINSLVKIYSAPLLQNETVNITTTLREAENIVKNLTISLKVDAPKDVVRLISDQITQSVAIAERYSHVARAMAEAHPSRPSNTYYFMLLSQALSENIHSVLAKLYSLSELMWRVYVEDSSASNPLLLPPMTRQEQSGLESFLAQNKLMPNQSSQFLHTYHSKFRVKTKSQSFFFYVKSDQGFVLKVDADICADQVPSKQVNMAADKEVDFSCEAYLEEGKVVDIYLYVVQWPLFSETATISDSLSPSGKEKPRLIATKEDMGEAFEINLKRVQR